MQSQSFRSKLPHGTYVAYELSTMNLTFKLLIILDLTFPISEQCVHPAPVMKLGRHH